MRPPAKLLALPASAAFGFAFFACFGLTGGPPAVAAAAFELDATG